MASQKIIALISGGSNGIGLSTVAALASHPNYHVIMGTRSLEKGESALLTLHPSRLPGTITLQQLDITSDASIAAAVAHISSTHGRLDILINNAGILSPSPSIRTAMRATLETNTTSHAVMTAEFAPLLRNSADPRIVYVSSELGSIATRLDRSDKYYGIPGAAYRASKAALNMLAACDMAQFEEENGGKGFKVFTYCPGYVVTDLSGPNTREQRVKNGAGSAEGSAQGIVDIVLGKRDENVGGFINREGVIPW